MEKEPAPHSATTIIRNITIGVITSVLAATVIYFLGYNKDEKADFKKKKEATIKVWSAYQENLRITAELFDKLKADSNNQDIVGRRAAISHEIEASLSTMENIKREPNADSRVYSTIDITVQQTKDLLALTNKFFDDMYAFAATNPTNDEGLAFIERVKPEFKNGGATIKQRDSARLATFYQGLNKDYDIVLPKN